MECVVSIAERNSVFCISGHLPPSTSPWLPGPAAWPRCAGHKGHLAHLATPSPGRSSHLGVGCGRKYVLIFKNICPFIPYILVAAWSAPRELEAKQV